MRRTVFFLPLCITLLVNLVISSLSLLQMYSEPLFIAQEISEALGYSKSFSLSQYFDDKLTVTKENGLPGIKKMLGGIHQRTSRLALLPSSSLQEYLLRYSTKPKAKEIGDRLYEIFVGGNPVFNPEVLDDWGTSIDELQKTSPQLFDASKKVNGFIFGLVGNRELANESKSWILFLLSLAIKSVQIQFSQKEDPTNLLYFSSLYRPENFKSIMTP